jgi:hypothetical protein
MAKLSSPPSRDGAERRVPRLREQVQIAYDLLRDLLGRAGYETLLAELEGLDSVNEVLRRRPESVPLLQRAAWELRHEKKFSALFRNQATGAVVEGRDEPIAPCGRTFAQVEQAHLYGAARLFFERLELDFAKRQAKAEAKAWRKERAEQKKKGLARRLVGGLKGLAAEAPRFDPDDYRTAYPGHGLYAVLKVHLNHDWQFHLIPAYARLGTRQAEALGDLIGYFTEARQVEMVAGLTAQDIGQARGFARAYAEATCGFSHGRRGDGGTEDQMARLAALHKEERQAFDLLLTRYLDCLPPLRDAGPGAEATVRRLAPVFKEEVFALFKDPTALENAVNCPDLVIDIIGASARCCPPAVSRALGQIQDKALTRDLLVLAMETLSPEEIEVYLADPVRLPIWDALPGRFNNSYRYRADAPEDSTTARNLDNLRMIAGGIFDSLRRGRTDSPMTG